MPDVRIASDAILRGIDLNSQTRTDSLEDAVKDLESLMKKAKEMVSISVEMPARGPMVLNAENNFLDRFT